MNDRINYRVYIKKAKDIVLQSTENNQSSNYCALAVGSINVADGNNIDDFYKIRSKHLISVDNHYFYEFLYLNSNKKIELDIFEYDKNGKYLSTSTHCHVKSSAIKIIDNRCDFGIQYISGVGFVGKHDKKTPIRYVPSDKVKYIKIVIHPGTYDGKGYFEPKKFVILKNTYPTIIHDSNSPYYSDHLLQPKLHLEDSSPGSFEFILAKNHKYYQNGINLLTDTIYITRSYSKKNDYGNNERIIWDGRVISKEIDVYGNMLCHCEGALAYLNDIRTVDYTNHNVETTIGKFIQDHLLSRQCEKSFLNNRMDRTFFDRFDSTTSTYIQKIAADLPEKEKKFNYLWTSSYENVLKVLDTIKDSFGFHYKIRYRAYDSPSDDIICRSFTIVKNLKDFVHKTTYFSTLNAEFGVNVFDCKKSSEISSFATAIIPRGKACQNAAGNDTNVFLTSTSGIFNGDEKQLPTNPTLNDNGDYRREYNLIKQYGYIEAVVDFEDVWSPIALNRRANRWFGTEKQEIVKKNIEVTLSNIKSNIIPPTSDDPYTDDEYIDIWTIVKVSIPQLGMTEKDPEIYFVSALDIPLDDYLSTSVTLINKKSLITDKKINAGQITGLSKGVIDTDNSSSS